MGHKRMFSLNVVDTDKFMDMPTSTQALYFHLGMHGDDDGFVSSPRKIARAAGCNEDDLKLLAAKGYIIPFESGVVVITDWTLNNTLRNDRYKATVYQAEKGLLAMSASGRYVLKSASDLDGIPSDNQSTTIGTPLVSSLEPQHNLTEHNTTERDSGAFRKAPPADKPPRALFAPPTVDDVSEYCTEKGIAIDPESFVDYYETNGWMAAGKNPMKDWKAAVRRWARLERDKPDKGNERWLD
ncbi:hypothetical protein B5F28_10410 [Gemmiger sp. An194]|nr:hypothetical protein B5F28_10410 [Gemmiger sp. An194]